MVNISNARWQRFVIPYLDDKINRLSWLRGYIFASVNCIDALSHPILFDLTYKRMHQQEDDQPPQ